MSERGIEDALKQYCSLINTKVIGVVVHDSQLDADDPYVQVLDELSNGHGMMADGSVERIKQKINFLNTKLHHLNSHENGVDKPKEDILMAISEIKGTLSHLKELLASDELLDTHYPEKISSLSSGLNQAIRLTDRIGKAMD